MFVRITKLIICTCIIKDFGVVPVQISGLGLLGRTDRLAGC